MLAKSESWVVPPVKPVTFWKPLSTLSVETGSSRPEKLRPALVLYSPSYSLEIRKVTPVPAAILTSVMWRLAL